MAARILAARRIIAYLPNLQSAVRHFKNFNFIEGVERASASASHVPSVLQGLSACHCHVPRSSVVPRDLVSNLLLHETSKDFSGKEIDYSVLAQFDETQVSSKENSEATVREPVPSAVDNLECLAVECDDLLKKDFKDLFADRDISKEQLSIITLSQKTVNDMTSWSPDVEDEREQLLEKFISSATEICSSLQLAGYWADFVEPESGRLYHGGYSPATLFETDHRYRKLGFKIQDLGCCKVILHNLWGAHVYVGSLFTNAPIDHPVITKLQSFKAEQN